MKRLLFILFLFCPVIKAQTTYYIDPSGNNGNDGSSAHPWLTLHYACAHATSSGDIIHVNSGTYVESQQCELEPNVDIEGVSRITSVIKSTYAGSTSDHLDGLILLSGGSNTAQHISNIKLDGNSLTGNNGIGIYQRNNVAIYNCEIINFNYVGVTFSGTSTGNSIYNNIIINCGGCIPATGSGHHPNIYVEYQTNFNCYNNTITQTARATNSNGEGISGYGGVKNGKFYNNTITTQLLNGTVWSFAIELWYMQGCEFYDNTIVGEVDCGKDVNKGIYAYGVSFHDNTVGPSAPNNTTYNLGLQFEQTAEGVMVYNNLFKNLYAAIKFEQYNYSDDYVDDVQIYCNIIYNACNTGGGGYGIYFASGPILPQYEDNIRIYNNVIVAHPTYGATAGIMIPTGNVVTDIMIRNNIISGFTTAPIYASQPANGTVDYLYTQNNLYYNNGNSNAPLYSGITPTHVTNANNNIGNPNFVSATDFHLTSESALAIGEGINVSLIHDYDEEDWNATPSIGAYEYGTKGITIATVTTTVVTNVTATTATGGGNVTDDGGATVTARGVCWSTGHNPTTASSKTLNGTGTGAFTSAITGLTEGLIYYVRAYATNSEGTAYGSERSFVAGTTPPAMGVLIKVGTILVKVGTTLIKHEE
jgi:hypothetical protein